MLRPCLFLALLLTGCAAPAVVSNAPEAPAEPVVRTTAAALPDARASLSDGDANTLAFHTYGGVPSCAAGRLLIRQGYVNCYSEARRVPLWVAFRVEPDFRNTPPREGRFDTFRKDPEVGNAVVHGDYTNSGFDRGHLAPYAVMGGDRDGDGVRAELRESVSDPDDERTVFEANYMSNMSPQRGVAFNRSGGVWFKTEALVRELVDDDGETVWVYAGPIYGPGVMERIGPEEDIEVPPAFFQIVVRERSGSDPLVLAFLLPHHERAHGEIEDFLVSIDVIEALTGLDFFASLAGVRDDFEERDTVRGW